MATEHRKPGRPRLDAGQGWKRIVVCFPKPEAKELQRVAADLRLPVSQFVRKVVRAAMAL